MNRVFVIFGVILFVVALTVGVTKDAVTNILNTNDTIVTIGSVTSTDITRFDALVNSQILVTAGRYDSFESPEGTPYQVDTSNTYIVSLIGKPIDSGFAANASIGYGDDAVQNSLVAPTNSVLVWDITFKNINGGEGFDILVEIPIDKYPWIKFVGSSYNFTAIAYRR